MTEEDTGQPDVSLDLIFTCLADPDRRAIISSLRDTTSIDLASLPQHPENPDHYHVHLPKLAEAEMIEWDRDADRIHRGPMFEQLRPCLALIEEQINDLPQEW